VPKEKRIGTLENALFAAETHSNVVVCITLENKTGKTQSAPSVGNTVLLVSADSN